MGFPWRPGSATGIGSLPGVDVIEAVRTVFDDLPDLPHLPELPARGPGADMIGRAAGLLVGVPVELYAARWRVASHPGRDLRRIHDLWERDLDELTDHASEFDGLVKVQVAGVWTLAASVDLRVGGRMLRDHGAVRDLAESLAEGVAAHLADVHRRLPHARVLLQIDEPSLPAVLAGRVPTESGYGTLRAIDPEVAAAALRGVVATASASAAAVSASTSAATSAAVIAAAPGAPAGASALRVAVTAAIPASDASAAAAAAASASPAEAFPGGTLSGGTLPQEADWRAGAIVHCCAPNVPLRLIADTGAAGVAVDLDLVSGVKDADTLGEVLDAGLGLFAGVVPTGGTAASASSSSTYATSTHATSTYATAPPSSAATSARAATAGPKAQASAAVEARLRDLWRRIGLTANTLAGQVVVTPACGLAAATGPEARRAMATAREAAQRLADS